MNNDTLNILIVDDDQNMAKTLADIFVIKGYQAQTAHTAADALEMIAQTQFDCVLSDIRMPNVNGVEMYKVIKAQQPDLPVVLMTAYAADTLVQEGLDEGVIAALTKPLDISLILTFFSSLNKECSIVIIDDDPSFSNALAEILRLREFPVIRISDMQNIMSHIKATQQIILLDMKLGHTDGVTVLKSIKAQCPYLPIVLITGYRREVAPAIETALNLGAYTCLYKPFEVKELVDLLIKIKHGEMSKTLQENR